MFIRKLISTVLVWGLALNATLVSAAPSAADALVSSTKFEKTNGELRRIVKNLTKGRGWVTVANLRKNMRGMMAAKAFEHFDAALAKVPQNAQVTFSINDTELKVSAPFESGSIKFNNSRAKTLIFGNGKSLSIKDIEQMKKDGVFAYKAPRSLLEYVSDLLIPRAEAIDLTDFGGWMGVLVGVAAMCVIPPVLDFLGIYDFDHNEKGKHLFGFFDECNGDKDVAEGRCNSRNASQDMPLTPYPNSGAQD